MSENLNIFNVPSHGQQNNQSAPSILTPQADPWGKTNPGPLVDTPQKPERK